mmetsp:Transcript_88301/g.129119  ORF Transcript_88301/g.129119 Transcript_88301/m.129119 type:complete len:234 (-) Transcript_88301:379-1080(-)
MGSRSLLSLSESSHCTSEQVRSFSGCFFSSLSSCDLARSIDDWGEGTLRGSSALPFSVSFIVFSFSSSRCLVSLLSSSLVVRRVADSVLEPCVLSASPSLLLKLLAAKELTSASSPCFSFLVFGALSLSSSSLAVSLAESLRLDPGRASSSTKPMSACKRPVSRPASGLTLGDSLVFSSRLGRQWPSAEASTAPSFLDASSPVMRWRVLSAATASSRLAWLRLACWVRGCSVP